MAQKTTVYLDPLDYRKLKALAQEEGRAPAALIREAVAEYARRHEKKRMPKSIGMGRSGRSDLSERFEEMLEGFGEDS